MTALDWCWHASDAKTVSFPNHSLDMSDIVQSTVKIGSGQLSVLNILEQMSSQ